MKLADFGLCKILNQSKEDPTINMSSGNNLSSTGSKDWIEGAVEFKLEMMKLSDTHNNKEDFTNTSLTNPRGTRGWMAPELFEEERIDYFKVDIWALGCIFAYTLTWAGEHPFGDDIDKRIDRIIKKEPMLLVQEDLNVLRWILPSKCSEVFELIKSMLDVNPTIRPTVDAVLENSFFSLAFSVSCIIYCFII